MVSTRQQSNVGSGGDNSGSESVGTTRSVRHSTSQSQSGHSGHEIVPVSSSSSTQPYVSNVKLLDLPHEVLEKIFSYIGYKNVSHMRLVCRQLDQVCSAILNSTFQRLQTQMLHRFQGIKAKMPRRESARRNHPLACESDIIETLHMRLTLLQMSFGKHIERKHCCFFAGEILDEVYRILHYIKVTPKLARPYKVTDELFDLSTMAMEYFKEHIEPTLPEIAYFGTDFLDFTGKGDESPGLQIGHADERQAHPPAQANIVLKKRIRKIKQGMKRYNYQLCQMRREIRHCRGKIAEQQKQILEYASRLDEYDKKNEETSRKFSTLLQELNKCKTELQYWRSKSPLNPVCIGCGQGMAPTPSEDLEALSNQGILLPELVAEEPPLFPLPPTPALPGTSADDMWTAWEGEETTKGKEVEKPAADVRSKRKSTTSSDHSNSGKNGPTPAKKPRSVLKARSKRL